MASARDRETLPEWIDDDSGNRDYSDAPEMESSMEMDDDEPGFDGFDGGEGDLDVKQDKAALERDYVPLWRLIEMSREDRTLRMELADFEDYEDSDGVDSSYASGLSH